MRHEEPQDRVKRQVVADYLSGKVNVTNLARRYNYTRQTIYRWVEESRNKLDENADMAKKKIKAPKIIEEPIPTDIKQLKQELESARLQIKLLEATIDIADEQLGTNIRKKSGTRQS